MNNLKATPLAILLIAFLPTPAFAQQGAPQKTTGQQAKGVATQPVEDVGIKKKKIPLKLKQIQARPYSLRGLKTCAKIAAEVIELSVVLGPDAGEKASKSKGKKRKETATKVAGSVVNSFIPFRGLIREVSGAAGAERRYNKAVYAGVIRRGFLKGVGLERGCRRPARP